ncbi:hypothetical protein DERP_007413 [Dermatophagoides pteronyssinus]|uniref:RING-type domain-containing protein n=1 Tax=Dermatophagoides pteronyssinus TaxID=6956 RepID=A0ABQ8J4J1_DERPT|nr:hypothetical protein DERP_007413 [Dermatophagoides pteronyssinus]
MTIIQTKSGPMMVTKIEILNDQTTFPQQQQQQKDWIYLSSALSSSNKLPDCWLCCERSIDCVLLDCGHLISCLLCAQQKIRRFGKCPVCRKIVWKVVRIYLAVD